MGKIIDQSEHRIQAHMDQRAYIQYKTYIPEVQARGTMIKQHMVAHHSKGRLVGPTWRSGEHGARPSGSGHHRITPSAGIFMVAS